MSKNVDISVLLDFYGTMLTEKQLDVVQLYYNEDLSLAEIAAHSGITRQGVRDSIKRAETQLLDYESRLKLVARFHKIETTVQEISDEAKSIIDFNKRFGANNIITTSANRIISLTERVIDDV